MIRSDTGYKKIRWSEVDSKHVPSRFHVNRRDSGRHKHGRNVKRTLAFDVIISQEPNRHNTRNHICVQISFTAVRSNVFTPYAASSAYSQSYWSTDSQSFPTYIYTSLKEIWNGLCAWFSFMHGILCYDSKVIIPKNKLFIFLIICTLQ